MATGVPLFLTSYKHQLIHHTLALTPTTDIQFSISLVSRWRYHFYSDGILTAPEVLFREKRFHPNEAHW